jgi:starch phosphorylase
MANLSIVGSHTVNGVSKLHSEILKNTVFHDFYKHEPDMFTNVTNGVAHRRWLCYSNPRLAGLLDECIGTGYRKSPEKLADFGKFHGDAAVYEQLEKIKRENKAAFALYLQNKTGVKLDPDSVFDVQIKRMHEYKRQLLNAIKIISIYNDLLENPDKDIKPQTFIFGAKAAPGYYMAKNIIKLIYYISQDIEKNPKLRDKIKVVFLEDYNVSLAEILIPAADISEQISLAGKEASGTGNMKLMINGAVTLGTLDGANVEISEAVGKDNIYIFGLTTEEVDDLWKRGYRSVDYYNNNRVLKDAVDRMAYGFDGVSFENMKNYLIYAQPVSDPYMCLADFDSYKQTHEKLIADYADREKWLGMSLKNIASAGVFASDRSIGEYARNIWGIEPAVFKKNKK